MSQGVLTRVGTNIAHRGTDVSLTAREPSSLLRPRSGHQHPTAGRLGLAASRALVELARSRLGRKPASQWTLSRCHSRVGLRGGPQTQAKAWIPLVASSTPRTEERQAPAVGTSWDRARPTAARVTLACVKGDNPRVAALRLRISARRSRRQGLAGRRGRSRLEPARLDWLGCQPCTRRLGRGLPIR